VYWIDPADNFRFVWANEACCLHFLRSHDDLVGLCLEDIDPTFGTERSAGLRECLRTHGSTILETIHLRGDGSVVPAELSANCFRHLGREYITGYIRDISVRKANESTLARAALLLSRLPDAVYCTELDGTVTFWNESAERIFGWSYAQLVGRPLLERFPPELAGEMRPRLAQALAGEECRGEWMDIRNDGIKIWTDTALFRFLDREGRPAGLLGISRDITERKQAEDERLALEQKLKETQRLESLGVLAGGIAHDFNNLLTGVLGNASLAKMDLPIDSPLEPVISQIETAALRAADLCKQMLAYSGRGQFVVGPVLLSQIVAETTHLLHSSLNKKASLVLELAKGIPPILGDATQMRQIVMNLVINAAEAIGNTQGTITVTTRRTQVTAPILQRCRAACNHPGGDSIELSVADTGCGIAPETLERIFEPFFTTKFTGRGLGLSAVLGIVRSHNGALDVTSSRGIGTTFRIFFPVSSAVADQPNEEPATNDCWHGAGTILVADDEDPVREVLGHILDRLGFSVVTACDGIEAIEHFRADPHKYSAVLLDMSMPRIDGLETLRELRALRADIPVLLISGHDSGEIRQLVGKEHLSGVVQKPFTAPALSEALQQALSPH
jgi:PAS domain S-box-containing protein